MTWWETILFPVAWLWRPKLLFALLFFGVVTCCAARSTVS